MADEVLAEKDFPCVCGNGALRIQVLEHDTWASGRHSRWKFECSDCAQTYRELVFAGVFVAREHRDEIDARSGILHERRMAIGQKAVDRYLPQFTNLVISLKFKSAMHDALGGHMSL